MNESMTMAAPAGQGKPPIVDAGSSAGPNQHLEVAVRGLICEHHNKTVEEAVNSVAGVDYDPTRVETRKSE